MSADAQIYRIVWRWHFYAGLIVIPFIIVLASTGMIYLFRPQIDRWEERAFQKLPVEASASADVQLNAVMNAFPSSQFLSYRLPEFQGEAAVITVMSKGENSADMQEVFVSPQGRVLGSLDPNCRIMSVVSRLHGQLLLGPRGSWIVELAASWAIVMILSGLYLWWPREARLAGVVWPRLAYGGRRFWKDMHAVAGFYVSVFALLLLLTGLPWATLWGSAFISVRAEMGWMKGPQQWTIGGQGDAIGNSHAEHTSANQTSNGPVNNLTAMVEVAERENLAFPTLIIPPGAPQRFSAPVAAWTIKSDAQKRPLQTSILYDSRTLQQISREDFADRHFIDRVIGYGVAWHEGQLFGWINQLMGVLTALCLIVISVSGFVMWRLRKPNAALGAPLRPEGTFNTRHLTVVLLLLALLLPMLAISLCVVALLDRLIVKRNRKIAAWLGV